MMSFDRAKGFYTAPFPSNDLRRADGSVDLALFPNPGVDLINQGIKLITDGKQGFAVSGAVFFQLSAPLDPTALPDLNASVTAGASVFLMGVDGSSPDFGKRRPVEVAFAADGGPFGAPNLLSVLPLQGIPLREETTYAAVVLRAARDSHRALLGVSPAMAALAAHSRPAGMTDSVFADYQRALDAVTQSGIAARDLAGLAVFTTGAPTAAMKILRADALARPLPAPVSAPVRTDLFADYCVYTSALDMPDYQAGAPPFNQTGGGWTFDAAGKPILQRMSRSALVVTVPRAPMPAGGFPLAVFIRTGGGGDRPLVDRGTQAVTGGPPITPGTGPALQFARAGFAGAQVDGPLGGLRNPDNHDEQFLIFNIQNATALRDNVRESALELIVFAHVMQTIQFDASDCPGFSGGPVRFETAHLTLMGHSMGGTIAPLVLANEPMYRAAILSGAGGSYIENVMFKIKPINLRPTAQVLLVNGDLLTEGDPVLTMVQWAAEPSDPQVYDARIVREPAMGELPRHILMEQGIVDHYIMPNIANTTSLSLGLDFAGAPLDTNNPEYVNELPLAPLLTFSHASQVSLPASGNIGGVTAVVIQHPADGIEDGHEIVFQTDPPKHQYRCFLQSFLAGTPRVPVDAAADAPCP